MQLASLTRGSVKSVPGTCSLHQRSPKPLPASQRPAVQQQRRCVVRHALEPSLLAWLSAYRVTAQAILDALDTFEARTCDDLQYLRKEDVDSLEWEGVSGVQLNRLRAAIKSAAAAQRHQQLTRGALGDGALPLWASRAAPAAAPAAAAAEAAPAAAAPVAAAPKALPPVGASGASQPVPATTGGAPAAPLLFAAPASAWFNNSVLGVRSCTVAAGDVSKVAFSPCGAYLATASETAYGGAKVKIFNVFAGKEEAQLDVYRDDEDDTDGTNDHDMIDEAYAIEEVTSLLWNADGRSLILGDHTAGHTSKLHHLHIPQRLVPGASSPGDAGGKMFKLAPVPDAGGRNGHRYIQESDAVHHVAQSPDGKALVAAATNGRMYVCDRKDGAWLTGGHVFMGTDMGDDSTWLAALSLCPDPASVDKAVRLLFVMLSEYGGLWVRDVTLSQLRRDKGADVEPPGAFSQRLGHKMVSAWCMSVDGTVMASGFEDGTVAVYDMTKFGRHYTGSDVTPPFRTLACASKRVSSLALTPCGGGLLCASDDGSVRLWDVKTGESKLTLQTSCGPRPGWKVAIAPSGKTAAAVSKDGDVSVWLLK